MTATATTVRIERFPTIADNPEALEQLDDGLKNAEATAGYELALAHAATFWHDGGEGYEEDTDALRAWGKLRDEAVAEILPDVARMLTEAINRRLPWTWEPER